jgi:hypothetical protein
VRRAAVAEANPIESAAMAIPATTDSFVPWPARTIHWNGNIIASAIPSIPPTIDVILQPLARSKCPPHALQVNTRLFSREGSRFQKVSPTDFPQWGQASGARVVSGVVMWIESLTRKYPAGSLASERDLKNDKVVNFGFFVDVDTTRYCGLRLRRLKEAIKDGKVQEALVEQLEVAGATGKDKMAAIERRIDELRATKSSLWFEVPAGEILAASIFKAKNLAPPMVDDLWKRVSRLQEIAEPLALWVNMAGLTPHAGRVPTMGRANIIGYRGGSFVSGGRVIGVEAINSADELGHALDEAKTAREQTSASYVACTPALVAEFLWARTAVGPRWEADALYGKLRAAGFGLLLVEGDAVAQSILPAERKLDTARLTAIATAMQSTGNRP